MSVANLIEEEYHTGMNTEIDCDEDLIDYLVGQYNSRVDARKVGVVYTSINKTFSIEIDDVPHTLHFNALADEVGDKLADEIKSWAHY